MRREKLDIVNSLSRQRSIQVLIGVGILYMLMVSLEVPFVFRTVTQDGFNSFFPDGFSRPLVLEELEGKEAPIRPLRLPHKVVNGSLRGRLIREYKLVSRLRFDDSIVDASLKYVLGGFEMSVKEAFRAGKKVWEEIQSGKSEFLKNEVLDNQTESCPYSISLSASEFRKQGSIIALPCGMTLGSHITVVGKPNSAHPEREPKISLLKKGQYVMVSQFMMELQGLKTVDGEDPPRILHFNPRLKGDWSGNPVIEQNTCYRMQWGSAHRCEGLRSRADEETVDGQVKCEKWILAGDNHSDESKAMWWLSRLIGRTKKVAFDWPFPFVEEKLFVLTLSAGLEGYHVTVDGRHVTSFPYRTGFTLEDATGLYINGDIEVQSIFAGSLPTTHPSYSPQRHLDMSEQWKAPSLPDGPIKLFIGILSAGNHFAERMAVRKSWMQHKFVKSLHVVARFFVALHGRKEVNVEIKKEATFFGDIVIVPYMDNYDLVVLKTVAICEYGARTASAKYIMKCDDDTFVRVDAVMREANKIADGKSLYIGKFNFHHKPLRSGKWAVTREEWPEQEYPPYGNGPGYVLSSDIAEFIVSNFERHALRLFKMEDVSVGMWVEQFNSTKPVEYKHNPKFCQSGCIEGYHTAHYQSPRQMICLWDKLRLQGKPLCCNMR